MAKPDFSRIKLLIIDMDNTLTDTFHTLSAAQWKMVAKAFEKRGQPQYAKRLMANYGKAGFVHTIKASGMARKDQLFAIRVYDNLPITPLKLFPDALALLKHPMRKVMLTRGEFSLQTRKARHVGLHKHCDRFYILHTFDNKEKGLKRILKDYGLKPSEALVIGDRVEEEITEARKLKMPCVLVKRPGRKIHKSRYKPTLTVRSLHTIVRLLPKK